MYYTFSNTIVVRFREMNDNEGKEGKKRAETTALALRQAQQLKRQLQRPNGSTGRLTNASMNEFVKFKGTLFW